MEEVAAVMCKAGVRPSPVRSLVLRELAAADSPLTVQEMETRLQTVDRSSITRTMSTFQNAGLVHAIADGTPSVKYEFCRADQTACNDDDAHVHFHCRLCGRTICLSDVPVPAVALPDGFSAGSYNFVVTGLCNRCNR